MCSLCLYHAVMLAISDYECCFYDRMDKEEQQNILTLLKAMGELHSFSSYLIHVLGMPFIKLRFFFLTMQYLMKGHGLLKESHKMYLPGLK